MQSALADGEIEMFRAAEDGDFTVEQAGGAGGFGAGGEYGVELEILQIGLQKGLVDTGVVPGDAAPEADDSAGEGNLAGTIG